MSYTYYGSGSAPAAASQVELEAQIGELLSSEAEASASISSHNGSIAAHGQTVVGRALVTAASAADGRSAIGADAPTDKRDPKSHAINGAEHTGAGDIVTRAAADFEQTANKDSANGYAPLDASKQLPASNAPAKAVYSTGGGQALSPGDIGADAAGAVRPPTASPAAGDVPIYTGGAWVNSQRAWATGETPATHISLDNTEPATVGVDQYTPGLAWRGRAWATGSGSSVGCAWRCYGLARQNATGAVDLVWEYQTGAGAFATVMSLLAGGLYVPAVYVSGQMTLARVNNATGLSTATTMKTSTNEVIEIVNAGRSNVAYQRAVALTYDANLASIDDNFIVAEASWVNNADARTMLWAVFTKGMMIPSVSVAAAPTPALAGRIGYCSNGNGGLPCLYVDTGVALLRIPLGAAISAT